MRRLASILVLAACTTDPTNPDTMTTSDATGATGGVGGTSGGTSLLPTTAGETTPATSEPTGGPFTTGTGTTAGTGTDESGTTAADTGDSSTGDALAGLVLEETFASDIENGWVRVERWQDENPAFIQEDRFSLDQRAAQTGQRLKFFASDPAPHSSRFLLYYAADWDSAAKPVPILLAHGANDQADRAWANPGESGDFGCGQSSCPDTGLMQDLVAAGYAVFAVSHAHSQGDNYFWAEQIGDALRIVRERTGAAQVDVIGWSKGVMSTRMYVSSLKQEWGTAYRGDVRKLILIGGPNLGFDYIFRYGNAHDSGIYADYGGKIHAPGPHDELLLFGQWQDRSEYAIFKSAKGDPFRGQLQMLARWDDVYPLTGTANNGFGAYAVADSESTYYGEGQAMGLLGRGKGIDVAVDQGSVIEAMVDAGVPDSVETYLLCGDLELDDNSKLIPGIPNEIAGPSDGVVFIDSCAAPDGIGDLAGGKLLKNVNHLQLGWHADAVAQIEAWLAG
ncbi:MAG: hypothetical protein JNL82_11160 [Myxococcales bacterium]|nr:hypothetical protein [Myxococcales bacterium]